MASACVCGQLLPETRTRLRLSPTHAGLAATDIDSSRFPIVPAEALDMIVVPLVAFDRTGTRLGYGGGCYDRYLPMLLARMSNRRHRL